MLLGTALLSAWWAYYRLALRPERSFGYNRAFLVLGPRLAGCRGFLNCFARFKPKKRFKRRECLPVAQSSSSGFR